MHYMQEKGEAAANNFKIGGGAVFGSESGRKGSMAYIGGHFLFDRRFQGNARLCP